ncbi:hypothetical protein ACFY36_27575 [Actinoplanes sp. NPDC000266]
MPQILLAALLLLQGQGTQSQLGLLAAVIVLSGSLVGCGVVALWSGARSVAGALTGGALAGFVVAVVAAFAAA